MDDDQRALAAEAAQLAKERDVVETAPAQPDDEHRIDADDTSGSDGTSQPPIKHDRTGRMTH